MGKFPSEILRAVGLMSCMKLISWRTHFPVDRGISTITNLKILFVFINILLLGNYAILKSSDILLTDVIS